MPPFTPIPPPVARRIALVSGHLTAAHPTSVCHGSDAAWSRAVVLAYVWWQFFSIPPLWGAAIFLAIKQPALWPLLIGYTCYIVGPGAKASKVKGHSSPLRTVGPSKAFWRAVADYFPLRIHKTADIPPGRPYIFCAHPHGILACGAFVGFQTPGAGIEQLFPGIDIHCATLTLNFRTPLLRESHLVLGTRDASPEAILSLLRSGASVGIAVGGGSEALHAAPGTNRVVLRRRKGFITLALLTGAALVPTFTFGETSLYSTFSGPRIRRMQRLLTRLLGFSIPLFHGRGVLLPYGLVPYAVPLNVVVGVPIEVPKYTGNTSSPSFQALVEDYHARYICALQQLFNVHKGRFAEGESDLEIVE